MYTQKTQQSFFLLQLIYILLFFVFCLLCIYFILSVCAHTSKLIKQLLRIYNHRYLPPKIRILTFWTRVEEAKTWITNMYFKDGMKALKNLCAMLKTKQESHIYNWNTRKLMLNVDFSWMIQLREVFFCFILSHLVSHFRSCCRYYHRRSRSLLCHCRRRYRKTRIRHSLDI